MVLLFNIIPDRPFYFPGDVLTATAEVVNQPSPPSTLQIVDVTVTIIGTEQIDPAYISASFHKDAPADPVRNSRRLSRTIFKTAPTRLLQACSLQPGERRLCSIRMTLPEHLPPSFKGTCVKFEYALHAEARYVLAAAAARASVSESASESVLTTVDVADDAASMTDLRSQASGVSAASAVPPPPPAAALSNAPPGAAVMQSMLLKVPLTLWPLETVDRSLLGTFVAGEDVELATPSAVYELGCPGCDLTLAIKEGDENAVVASDMPRSSAAADTAALRQVPSDVHRRRLPRLLSGDSGSDDAGAPVGTPSAADGLRRLALWGPTDAPGPAMPKTFNIRLSDSPLVQVCLHPPLEAALAPGSTFGGVVDLGASYAAHARDAGAPHCLALTITLETEEVVADKWLLPSRSGHVRRIYEEQVEVTRDTLLTHFSFTIPHDAPASFALPVVSLRWLLRFEFGVASEVGMWTRSQQQSQLVWQLPVLVRPPG